MTRIYGSPIQGTTEVVSSDYNTSTGDKIKILGDVLLTQSFANWWNNAYDTESQLLNSTINQVLQEQPDALIKYMRVEIYEFRYTSLQDPSGTYRPISEYDNNSPIDSAKLHLEMHLEDVGGVWWVYGIIALIIVAVAAFAITAEIFNYEFARFVTTVEEHPFGSLVGVGLIIVFLLAAIFLLLVFLSRKGRK